MNDQRSGLGLILYKGEMFFEGHFSNDYTDGIGVLIRRGVYNLDYNKNNTKDMFTDVQGCIDKQEIFGSIENLPNFKSLPVDSTDLVFLALTGSSIIKNFDKNIPNGKFLSGKLNGAGIARFGKSLSNPCF